MQAVGGQVLQALLTAVLVPIGLLVSLVLVKASFVVWRAVRRLRVPPIVVHPLNFEHDIREFIPNQKPELIELPSRLRDFIAEDETLRAKLAPGPVSPVAPALSAAAPKDQPPSSWVERLLDATYARSRSAYHLVLVPEVPEDGFSVGAQVVEAPRDRLVAAQSFDATTMAELTLRIGSFCIEAVLAQPMVLRRSPRWEHWARGAYEAFRRGNLHHRKHEFDDAHAAYNRAAQLAPGNIRITLHHGGLHEDRGEFREAAVTYNAGSCLWRQNIDVSYRLAAATVNHVLTSDGMPPAQARALVEEANRALADARSRLGTLSLIRRLLATFHPRRRDPGERRYWYSWLRPDPYPASLRLLRRSKGHEYRCALSVAMASNALLLHTIAAGEAARDGDPSVGALWRRVDEVVGRRRSGWLAHWSAACFFSRALKVDHGRPRDAVWRRDWERRRRDSLTRFAAIFEESREEHRADDWRSYCSERAVVELGRVVRNPSSQLDRRWFHEDPDMRRLHAEPSARLVAVLVGLGSTVGTPS